MSGKVCKWRTVALLTLVVAGCTTPEKAEAPAQVKAPELLQTPEHLQTSEQRQKRELQRKRIAAENKRIAEHLQRDLGPICTSAGLTPGTDVHSRCMDRLYRLELERRAASSSK